jgi:hypothetical protein
MLYVRSADLWHLEVYGVHTSLQVRISLHLAEVLPSPQPFSSKSRLRLDGEGLF